MDFRNAINKFLNKMGYIENKDCEGIIFYGSYATGFQKDDSDLDLHVVFNDNEPERLYRGIDTVDDFRIEYFEKPIGDLYARAVHDLKNQSNVLLSMIGYGQTLFDRNGEIDKLQRYIIDLYTNNELVGLSDNEIYEQIMIINNRLIDLDRLCRYDDPYFLQLYHLTLEKIRKFFYKKNGLPEIPTSKVLDFYLDDTYSKSIFKTTPPVEFIEMFFEALDSNKSNEELMQNLYLLYDYCKGGYDINPEQSRVLIKSRNKIIPSKTIS